jgi:membrane fusion protein (multidrug efflux system)
MLPHNVLKFVTAAGCWILLSCGNKQAQQPPAAPAAVAVTVAEVVSVKAVYHDEYPGILIPLNQTDLRAQVTGYVTGIHFKDGSKVNKGQKLYSIDAQVYDASYQNALANVQVQETNLIKAQKDADRYHELDKNDAIAKQQVDYADAALEAAKKQVSAAKATLRSVQANVNFATIIAPFTGTIGISLVRLGSAVVAGQTVMNTISTDDPMAVDFVVDQKDIYRFMQLQKQSNQKNDSTFTLNFGSDTYPAPGRISLIDRSVDPQTGTIKIRLVFPNPQGVLKAGMNTTVRILNNASEKVIKIPYKAVTEQLGEFFVYVVDDSSKVSQRKIKLGKQIGTDVIVKDGLKEGEKIVVEGSQNLREGSLVTTAPPPSPATSAPKK